MSEYQRLLEFPDEYIFGEESFYDKSSKLVERMDVFLSTYHPKNVIVSLSGGVDSMVIFALLLINKEKHGFNLTSASINYDLREEAGDELEFIKRYTKKYELEIPINYSVTLDGISRKKEDSGSRKVFEETSREIRFNLYHDIIKNNSWNVDETIIIVGHHQDDLIENIFNNFMQGRDLTDLSVMKEISINRGIRLGRPLLEFPKSVIYEFSHMCNIPYFKNTTPEWSKRGLMREQLFPLLDKIYNINWKQKMLNQGKLSDELSGVIDTKIDVPVIEKPGVITFMRKDVIGWDKYLWSKKLSEILHHHGMRMVSGKSMKQFLAILSVEKSIGKGVFNSQARYFISPNEIILSLS